MNNCDFKFTKEAQFVELSRYYSNLEVMYFLLKAKRSIEFLLNERHKNNIIIINDQLYFYKVFVNYLNELIGSFLAKYIGLKSLEFKFGKITNGRAFDYFKPGLDSLYVLLSPDFREKNKIYVYPNKLKIPAYTINSSEFDEFKRITNSEENYELLVHDILRFMILNFLTTDIDRNWYHNVLFERNKMDKNNWVLGPAFDFEFSFQYENRLMTTSRDYFSNFEFPSKKIEHLLKKYPILTDIINSVISLDVNELLNSIEKEYNLEIYKNIRQQYIEYFEKRKTILMKCL